jgi:murein L,D-transpeptidase YcbB/YkuD
VPYSIATRDILPQVRKDPDYLARRGFIVRDRNGNVAEPRAIDWSALGAGNFPYTLVQQPGPTNALGRVKFMFPNKHAVYLHDTPSRYLFERAERAFSSGCIRVEQPFELAEILLRDDGWDQRRILELVDSGETKRVLLRRPMPVLLMYWTAEVLADGRVFFYNDIYERDGAVSAALDEPFRLEPPGS